MSTFRALLRDDLGVTEGDLPYPVRTPNGVELTRFDPAFADIMEDAEDYMRRHHNAMRELAK